MYEWIREISDLHLPLHFSSEWFILPCCVTQIYHLFCVLLGLFQNLATLWFSAFYRETSFCLYVNAEVYARHCDFTSCSYLFLCAECRIRDGSYVRTTLRKAFFQWIVSPVWLACGTQLFLGNFLEHFFFVDCTEVNHVVTGFLQGRCSCCLKELFFLLQLKASTIKLPGSHISFSLLHSCVASLISGIIKRVYLLSKLPPTFRESLQVRWKQWIF